MFTYYNSSHSDYDEFFAHSIRLVKLVHLFRALIAIVACIPNAFVIFLYWKAAKRRPSVVRTRLNYAIINLLISNIVYCTVLCVYSFLKRFANSTLTFSRPCLTITWFAVFASFEPLWAMGLVALCRSIYFSRNDRFDRFMSLGKLASLRLLIFLLNVLVASVIITGEADEAVQTHCNYQLMLDNSKKYLAYSFLIVVFVVVIGVTNFVFRILIRQDLLRRIYASENFPAPDLSSTNNENENGNTQKASPDSDREKLPAMIWQKPKIILIASIVVILFLLPRIAFFCHSRPFWLVSTLCPALMAFFLPLAFIWITKELRLQFKIVFTCSSGNSLDSDKAKIRRSLEDGFDFATKNT